MSGLYAYQVILKDRSYFVEACRALDEIGLNGCILDTRTKRRIFIRSDHEIDSLVTKIPYVEHVDKEEMSALDFYAWIGFFNKDRVRSR